MMVDIVHGKFRITFTREGEGARVRFAFFSEWLSKDEMEELRRDMDEVMKELFPEDVE